MDTDTSRKPLIILIASLLSIGTCLVIMGVQLLGVSVVPTRQASISEIQQSFTVRTPDGAVITPAFNSETTMTSLTTSLTLLAVVLLLLMIVAGAAAGFIHAQRQHQRRRDAQRRADLQAIVQGFILFYQEHGNYPISMTYNPHYYSVVNLSNDWAYYGMPDTQTMQRYIPHWPMLDPLRPAIGRDQTSQYLYYPHDNGQRFDLFAHLEMPSTLELGDYNREESIPEALGLYNYKVTSPLAAPQTLLNQSPAITEVLPVTESGIPETPASELPSLDAWN
jgi:hypothetical protein